MENTTTTSKAPAKQDVTKPRLTAEEFKKEFKRQWILIAIGAVYVVYGLIFNYLPLLGWIMAFQDYKYAKGFTGSEWVGLGKFQFLFSDNTFLMVIRNTFAMGVLNLVFSTVFAIGFAILLNEVRHTWFKKTIQTISYMPHFLSWIIVVAIVHDALTSTGIINEILMNLKIVQKPYPFLQKEAWFWPIVTFSHLWKETGWNAIIYLAAITSIDPCLYESASIDGAGPIRTFFSVTIPLLKPSILVALLFRTLDAFRVYDLISVLTGGAQGTETLSIYAYKLMIGQSNYGYGSAVVLAMAICVGIIAFVFVKVLGAELISDD